MPATPYDSNVDTILTLPERAGSNAIADACRETALTFINDSWCWGKAELAMWLMGPYAQLTQYILPTAIRRNGLYWCPVPLLRDIDAHVVERIIGNARAEIAETLRRMTDLEGAASFAFTMLWSGFVARCEDKSRTSGWVPTTEARRLSDRVLSLFAADYLARPADYEAELSVCTECKAIDFGVELRARGVCHRHHDPLPCTPRPSLPYFSGKP